MGQFQKGSEERGNNFVLEVGKAQQYERFYLPYNSFFRGLLGQNA